MRTRIKITCLSVLSACFILIGLTAPGIAQDWDQSYAVRVTYQELDGEDLGYADVTLSITLPAGTPLLGRETALSSALAALHDLWAIESVHEDVRGFLGPVIPMDVQYTVSEISGDDFILTLVDSFDTVSEAGFSRFQVDTPIRSTERINITPENEDDGYPSVPRYFAWVVGDVEEENQTGYENWVIASLINYSASILSFRSELGRFPRAIAELYEQNHLLIEPLNPYTGGPVQSVSYASPGDITFEYIDSNRVTLATYIQVGNEIDTVRREINVSASGAYDLLYRQTSGLSDDDKIVARYVFQISQILNEYYFEHLDLPYRIPQCEAEGFAYVSFQNPYTVRDAAQADSLAEVRAGDYTYHRISPSSYFLVGYGGSGEAIISVSRDFGSSTLEYDTLDRE